MPDPWLANPRTYRRCSSVLRHCPSSVYINDAWQGTWGPRQLSFSHKRNPDASFLPNTPNPAFIIALSVCHSVVSSSFEILPLHSTPALVHNIPLQQPQQPTSPSSISNLAALLSGLTSDSPSPSQSYHPFKSSPLLPYQWAVADTTKPSGELLQTPVPETTGPPTIRFNHTKLVATYQPLAFALHVKMAGRGGYN